MANIGKQIYDLLIAPRHRDEDIRNREIVLNVLLTGTLFITLLGLLLLIAEIFILQDAYLLTRTLLVAGVAAFVGGLSILSRRGWHRVAASMLVGVYFLLATALAYHWGINIPVGALLYGLVVVLAGILLGSAFSPYAAALIAVTLVVLVQLTNTGIIHPNLNWTTVRPGLADAIGFSLILGIIALVSWLFNHQMERSLRRAERAEAALLKQKDLLEDTVQERTQELQAVQLEKIQQMYRFAELGQLSTALLHELANHLTTLTIDIEGLEGQTRSTILNRAKRSIRYIDDMVVRVRDQLHGSNNIRTFSVVNEIEEIIKVLRHKAQTANVLLQLETPADKKGLRSRGEPIRLRQLIANLVSNGIDAYPEPSPGSSSDSRRVVITASGAGNNIIITVEDWGRGITAEDRGKLFELFFSTKKTGMGMGLFIAKQIAEEHFLGTISIDTRKPHTAFVVKLPKAHS